MKILFLTENYPPETNAAANRVHERAKFWAEWGHDVTVITCAPNFPKGRLHDGYANKWYQTSVMDGIRVVRVKTYITANAGVARRMLDFLSFMITGFVASLFQKRPDVVVATSPQFFTAVAGWAVGLCRRRPFVLELGDIWPASIIAVGAMEPSFMIRMLERLELFLYRQSAAIVALTPKFKENLVGRGIDGDKIPIVINGVDTDRFQETPRDDALSAEWGLKDRFVIGYIGTHGMAHGLANVLDAAEQLRGNDRVTFLFVGDGAERDALMSRAAQEGLDNVQFIASQPRESMPSIWSVCDVALVHLRDSVVFSEVIPSKIFEAMAMGLPTLLVAPKGVASDIVLSTRSGVWVPAEQPDRLAHIAARLADKPRLLDMLGRNGSAVSGRFSRRRQAEEMMQVLEIAAAGDGGRAGVDSDPQRFVR
ncbi:MAG: colanic acid biosynthesis glycosyl transferase WcaI [Paracoccaceae bacterium]|jgi:colanic acid biosynthesis glycosyl transferase WcaI